MSSRTDCPKYWRLAVTFSCAVADAPWHARLGSVVPRDRPCAITKNNSRPFAKAADRSEAFARNNHFGECRRCHSKSLASHVRVDDPSQLRLAGMVVFSSIGYHSGRSGRLGWIWSSGKFARPSPFCLVFKRSLRNNLFQNDKCECEGSICCSSYRDLSSGEYRELGRGTNFSIIDRWYTVDLTSYKITADDALQVAEENGGKEARSRVKNDCRILIRTPNHENDDRWDVSYYFGVNFEMLVDPYSGQYQFSTPSP